MGMGIKTVGTGLVWGRNLQDRAGQGPTLWGWNRNGDRSNGHGWERGPVLVPMQLSTLNIKSHRFL